MHCPDHVVLPVLALQTAAGIMLITVAASMYGTGLPLINVVLLVLVAIVWMVAAPGDGASPFGGGESLSFGNEINESLAGQTWSAAAVGALIALAFGGTFILFRAGVVQMPGTLLTTVGDTLLLSAILVALRVYFIGGTGMT